MLVIRLLVLVIIPDTRCRSSPASSSDAVVVMVGMLWFLSGIIAGFWLIGFSSGRASIDPQTPKPVLPRRNYTCSGNVPV